MRVQLSPSDHTLASTDMQRESKSGGRDRKGAGGGRGRGGEGGGGEVVEGGGKGVDQPHVFRNGQPPSGTEQK